MSNQPVTPKPSRNTRRNPNRAATTPTSVKAQPTKSPLAANNSTSPRPTAGSPGGKSAHDSSSHLSEGASGKEKTKKKRSNNSSHQSPRSDTTPGHRHSASQPSLLSSPPFGDGSRYAGPTFHASPAASTLPIPTFFSKSVPGTDWSTEPGIPSLETEYESQDAEVVDFTPSKPRSSAVKGDLRQDRHSSSPLDFLFRAARDAKGAAQSDSTDGYSERTSPARQTPQRINTPQSTSTDGAMFSFEMENSESKSIPIGPSFATPYKERMNSLRSANSPTRSPYSPPHEEGQGTKAEPGAQKRPLPNPHQQSPYAASPQRPAEYLNGHTPSKPSLEPPTNISYAASGHVTPVPARPYDQRDRARTSTTTPDAGYGKNTIAQQYAGAVSNSSQLTRTPSSNLRKEMSPPSPTLSPSRPQRGHRLGPMPPHPDIPEAAGSSALPPARSTPYHKTCAPSVGYDAPNKAEPMDTKQMEDYLRQALKLDSSGRQNSRDTGHETT